MTKIEIDVPDQIVELLKALDIDVELYCQRWVIWNFGSDLEVFLSYKDTILLQDKFQKIKQLIDNLKEIPYYEKMIQGQNPNTYIFPKRGAKI